MKDVPCGMSEKRYMITCCLITFLILSMFILRVQTFKHGDPHVHCRRPSTLKSNDCGPLQSNPAPVICSNLRLSSACRSRQSVSKCTCEDDSPWPERRIRHSAERNISTPLSHIRCPFYGCEIEWSSVIALCIYFNCNTNLFLWFILKWLCLVLNFTLSMYFLFF